MGGGNSAPAPTIVQAPKVAPEVDQKALDLANKKKSQRTYGSRGRIGTVLSEGSSLG